MGLDEVGTLRTLTAHRIVIDRLIASHRGRIFNTAGDSVVADFASAVDAVQCAVAVQVAIATADAGGAADEPMQFRIGGMSAMSWSRATTCSATVSILPPGWKASPSPVRSV